MTAKREHIYRRHQMPTYRCNRCFVAFGDEEKLREHNRAATQCEVQIAQLDEETIYICQAQATELRKRQRDVQDEDRWVKVFQIIFPDVAIDKIPSPCK